MNAITHNAAYCFYPYGTLVDRSTLVIQKHSDPKALAKYKRRGFTILEFPASGRMVSKNRPMFQSGKRRWANDAHTWCIRLQRQDDGRTEHVFYGRTSPDEYPLANNSWTLTLCKEGARMDYVKFASALFCYSYVFAEDRTISNVIEPFFRGRCINEHLWLPTKQLYNCRTWHEEVERVREKRMKSHNVQWYVSVLYVYSYIH